MCLIEITYTDCCKSHSRFLYTKRFRFLLYEIAERATRLIRNYWILVKVLGAQIHRAAHCVPMWRIEGILSMMVVRL